MHTSKKNIGRILDSGLFDEEWYLREYPDVKALGINPAEHYLWIGSRLKRNPSLKFDSRAYLDLHKDVERHGRNALLHYLKHGKAEGRVAPAVVDAVTALDGELPVDFLSEYLQPFRPFAKTDKEPAFELYGEHSSHYEGDVVSIDSNECLDNPEIWAGTLGVHLHLYYPEMAWKFFVYLKNIPVDFDLYISVCENTDTAEIELLFQRLVNCRKLTVRSFPNRGRDIGPMLAGFGSDLLRYDLLCHIHSKKSPQNRLKRDWGTQLLHHLACSRSHISSLLDMFGSDPDLGMVFPIYHSALRTQINWGTNFPVCQQLAQSLHQHLDSSQFLPFPAGSFFIAKTGALRPLFSAGLKFEDFPEEQAQVDGTLAHAIERMIPVVVHRQGYTSHQVRSTKPHTLTNAYMGTDRYTSHLLENLKSGEPLRLPAFRLHSWPEARICIYSCATGGYDRPLIPEARMENSEFVFFTDTEIEYPEPWQVKPTAYWNPDPVKVARFYKTNPDKFLIEFDIVIWIDANIVITGDISKYIDRVILNNASFGVIRHPYRSNAYEEAASLIDRNMDNPEVIGEQIISCREQGYPENVPMTETNFLIMDLNRQETRNALAIWWSEINKFSRRDQISFDFACWKAGAKCVGLFDEGGSVRSNPDFVYFIHGGNSYPYNDLRPQIIPAQADTVPTITSTNVATVQIVICIHNALPDVMKCIESVLLHTDIHTRVLLVNDNSDMDTTAYLNSFVSDKAHFEVRNLTGGAWGYCRAANEGLIRSDYGDAVLLLNSDTIVTTGWVDSLVKTANRITHFGVVGPMSNAASYQSIPDFKSTTGQTAINRWPKSVSLDEINRKCYEWAGDMESPVVPLVHGFCQLISRKAINAVGGFDEALFPYGYGEENDFCFRSGDAGFRHQIDLRTYVHHEKSKSYNDSLRRQELMSAGSIALKRRFGERRLYNSIKIMEEHPALVVMRMKAAEYLASL